MTVRLEAKRVAEVRDYTHDWSAFLGGDTIETSVWTAVGVTKDSDSHTDTAATVWLSGGAEGTARLTNTITTAGGRTESEDFALQIGPRDEPISFATAAAHLRLGSDTSEQALVEGYITAAREWVENYTGHVLVRRPITETAPAFGAYLQLLRRPVVGVTEIAYTDTDGAAATVDSFTVMNGAYPARVYPAHNESWPSIRANTLVEVTYTAGYAAGEEPQALIQAMLLLVGHWYANREAVTDRTAAEVPLAATSLCDQFRVPGL